MGCRTGMLSQHKPQGPTWNLQCSSFLGPVWFWVRTPFKATKKVLRYIIPMYIYIYVCIYIYIVLAFAPPLPLSTSKFRV